MLLYRFRVNPGSDSNKAFQALRESPGFEADVFHIDNFWLCGIQSRVPMYSTLIIFGHVEYNSGSNVFHIGYFRPCGIQFRVPMYSTSVIFGHVEYNPGKNVFQIFSMQQRLPSTLKLRRATFVIYRLIADPFPHTVYPMNRSRSDCLRDQQCNMSSVPMAPWLVQVLMLLPA